jgi:hypothetical protein
LRFVCFDSAKIHICILPHKKKVIFFQKKCIFSGAKKPPKNGEDSGGQKINNMKHKNLLQR